MRFPMHQQDVLFMLIICKYNMLIILCIICKYNKIISEKYYVLNISAFISQGAGELYFSFHLISYINYILDYIEDLGWNRFGLQQSEMLEVVADRDVSRLNLELLLPQPSWT